MTMMVEQDIRTVILGWMADASAEHDDVTDAANAVLDRIEREGMAMRVLREIGPGAFARLWGIERHRLFIAEHPELEHRGRPRATTGNDDEVAPAVLPEAPKPSAVAQAALGQRRVNLSALRDERATLEAIYEVRGRWVRLGQLSRSQCQTLCAEHTQKALENRKLALFFGRLADTLNEGQTVGQRYGEAELQALMQESDA